TQNIFPTKSQDILAKIIGSEFRTAHLFEPEIEIQIDISQKGKCFIRRHEPQNIRKISPEHDRPKKRLVDLQRPYLQAIGITNEQHRLIPAMSAKWKQINKFIEIFEKALSSSSLDKKPDLKIMDFGSGKGYLTFAIYDHLLQRGNSSARVMGVELQETLVKFCNQIASQTGQPGLEFLCGDVEHYSQQSCDVMIALHACDIATDHAIHYGIRAG